MSSCLTNIIIRITTIQSHFDGKNYFLQESYLYFSSVYKSGEGFIEQIVNNRCEEFCMYQFEASLNILNVDDVTNNAQTIKGFQF